MTSSIKVLRTSHQKLAVTGKAFVRKQINVGVVSKIAVQPVFKILEDADEKAIAPKLKADWK